MEESLTLLGSVLAPGVARPALALAAGAFPRLRRLDASRNQISSRGIAALESLGAEVEA